MWKDYLCDVCDKTFLTGKGDIRDGKFLRTGIYLRGFSVPSICFLHQTEDSTDLLVELRRCLLVSVTRVGSARLLFVEVSVILYCFDVANVITGRSRCETLSSDCHDLRRS